MVFLKKYWPILSIILGVLVVVIAIIFVIRRNLNQQVTSTSDNTQTLPEITLANRPFTSLIPSTDGYWLRLIVSNIKIQADSVDYELIYNLPDGRQQGVPGTVKLTGGASIQRDLLLGSESSGKYKYDHGVETGTLTLRFRDVNGKLLAKFSTDFHLQTGTDQITSANGKFTYKLDKSAGAEYLVTIQTFGLPYGVPASILEGPYGVFKALADIKTAKGILSTTTAVFPGTVTLSGGTINQAIQNGGWTKLDSGKTSDVGVFFTTP